MDEELLQEIREEQEKRPRYCGNCTWLDCRSKCAHGAGPRSGETVGPEELSCSLGKGTGAFTEWTEYLDGDESWDRVQEAKDEENGKMIGRMVREISRWHQNQGWTDHKVAKGVWRRRGVTFRVLR